MQNSLKDLLVLLFLALLGSHFLNYHLYLFIVALLFLINWKNISLVRTLLVASFIISTYITWIYLDSQLLTNYAIAMQVFLPGLLILLMYILGLGVPLRLNNSKLASSRYLFYLLFIFSITYAFFIFLSYFLLAQDTPLTSVGMFTCFPNVYQLAQINGGRLISTILAYYLTLMSFIFPLILFRYQKFKQQGFLTIELILLLFLSIFVLYISAVMGRRTVILLFSLVFIYLLTIFIMRYITIKKSLIFMTIVTTAYITYNLYNHNKQTQEFKTIIITDNLVIPIVNSNKVTHIYTQFPVIQRVLNKGLEDKRFSWWGKALDIIFTHPYGGGNGIYLTETMKLAHNVWLDIGKDLGVIPFILLILITLSHGYYLIHIFFVKKIDPLLKIQLLIIGIGLFSIMMIEPIFNSDKTFFAYIFFYLGFVSNVYYKTKSLEATLQ